MKRTTNIFIVLAILLATTLSQVQLWKCLVNGDLLLSPGCLVEVEQNTCCSNHADAGEDTITNKKCCKQISFVKDLNLEKIDIISNAKERKVLNLQAFLSNVLCNNFHAKDSLDFFNNLPPPENLPLINFPIYLSHCSLLC